MRIDINFPYHAWQSSNTFIVDIKNAPLRFIHIIGRHSLVWQIDVKTSRGSNTNWIISFFDCFINSNLSLTLLSYWSIFKIGISLSITWWQWYMGGIYGHPPSRYIYLDLATTFNYFNVPHFESMLFVVSYLTIYFFTQSEISWNIINVLLPQINKKESKVNYVLLT